MTTLLDARAAYFRDNGFGADGGYGDPWVVLGHLGPIPLGIPNSAGRVRAVRYHDLHHVLTGYATDLLGEAEIAAWELASGCADHYAAWLLNLSVMPVVALRPGGRDRLLRAWVRGAHSRNLYRVPFTDALLRRSVDEVRADLGLESADRRPATARDRARFRRFVALGVVVNLLPLAVLFGLAAAAWAGVAALT